MKKIIRVTVDLVVDQTTDTKQLIQDMDYDFIGMNEEMIYETEVIDFEELDY